MIFGSNHIELVNGAFWFIVSISFILLSFITFLMIYFVFKYNRKKGKKAVNIHGNTKLEIIWTVIPVILVMAMFWYGWIGYRDLKNPPKDAMIIKVTAQMWKWTFEYDNGVKTDSLYVPVNKAIEVNLHSLDVNHSFFIPAFRFKRDVMPNRNNSIWFLPATVGKYDIACAEYCGLNHSAMYSKVIVLPKQEYDAWMKNELAKKNASSTQLPIVIDSTKVK
ncbi:MAG: cytochrome c oxidase subunit II [Ignavibacteriaceae bacterium]|nr:cytochrome c oxidase subunit II [Ignavibacteriaceae bacterium]